MVVYPAGFSSSADTDLRNSRIGYHTYTRDSASVVTASGETDEGPMDAPSRPDTSEFWLPPSTPAWWLLDMGSPQPISYVGIAGHQLGSKPHEVSCEVSDDASTWEQFSSEVMPSDDSPIMFLDTEVTRRYCRVNFSGLTSPDDPARVAVINVGVALAMPRSIYGGHKPLNLSRVTKLTHNMSKGGQFLGQAFIRNGVTGSASFRYLDPAWYRAQFDLFVQSARQYPYFFAWRPQDYPREVGYVWTDKDISGSNMGTREFMQVSWNMDGIGNA